MAQVTGSARSRRSKTGRWGRAGTPSRPGRWGRAGTPARPERHGRAAGRSRPGRACPRVDPPVAGIFRARRLGQHARAGRYCALMSTFDWGVGRYEDTAAQLESAARVVVTHAAPTAGEHAVDVGCGT